MNMYGQPLNNPMQMSFPKTYPQLTQNPILPQNNITWVQGIEGAKAFQMSPNSNAILMDSENDGRFYIKICDNVGMSSLRFFKYEEITDTPQQSNNIDLSEYVKKSELKNLITSMIGGIKNESTVPTNESNSSKNKITK